MIRIQIDRLDSDDVWTINLTRNDFNDLCGDILRGTIDIVDEALEQAKMKESDIDVVVISKFMIGTIA